MKKIKYLILATLGIFGFASFVIAQTANNYHIQRISVTSASSPVQILPPDLMASLVILNEATSPAAVYVWAYSGNVVPTAVPSACASPTTSLNLDKGCVALGPGQSLPDGTVCEAPNCVISGQAWAAAAATSTAAITVDTVYRGATK